MNNTYSKISTITGPHIAGLIKVQIVPREWISNPIDIDFSTGEVIHIITLIPNKAFIDIQLIDESYLYDEKPKSSKGGSFYDITLSGTANDLSPDTFQTLNTYRYHEFVAIIQDKQKRLKVIGNQDAGLILQFENKVESKQGGTQTLTLDFNIQQEYPSPFYNI